MTVSASRARVFLLFLLAARAAMAAPLAAQARGNPQTPMDSAEALYSETPTLSGFGFGVTLGSDGLGGGDNDLIGQAMGPDIFIRYGTSWGLEVHGGMHLSHHGIAGVTQEYNFFGPYIEPRYVMSSLSGKWGPSVGGRVGPVWERVNESGVNFTASGYSLGASAGILLKVNYQIALEMGLSVNRVSFGDYSFDGELSWSTCLEPHIATRTALPASVVACTGSRRRGQPQILPDDSNVNLTSSGVRETILHPGSSRTGIWTRFFIGFNLGLTSGR